MSKPLLSSRCTTRWFIFAAVVYLLMSSCSKTVIFAPANIDNVDSALLIIIETDSVTVGWSDTAKAEELVSFYELYVRPQNVSSWSLLKSNIEVKTVVIYRKELSMTDSIFNFAVQSVAASGKKSGLHASFDAYALPSEWTVFWKK